jgi:hypothetical protein
MMPPLDDKAAVETVEKPAAGSDTAVVDKAVDTGGDKTETVETPKTPAKKPATSLLDDDEIDDGGEGDAPADKVEGDKPADGDKKEAVGDFPDDWREKLAKGDDKKLARLKRYTSVEAALLAGFAAQDKIRSGDYKVAELAEDASPEEKKAFYEERGIPAEAKAYDIPKVPGHVWTDADTPVLDSFKELAHATMLPQSAMDGIAKWYATNLAKAQEAREQQTLAKDAADREAITDTLRSELGAEYKPATALMRRLLKDSEALPDGLGDFIAEARGPDGQRLINNPAMVRVLMQISRYGYGDVEGEGFKGYGEGGFITPDAAARHSTKKAEIERIMKTDMKKYYDEGHDVEYAKILADEAKHNRGRAA